jgi:hypothetical protein
MPAQSVAHHHDPLALHTIPLRHHHFVRRSDRPSAELLKGVQCVREEVFVGQELAAIPVKLVFGFGMSQSGRGDLVVGVAALFAEFVADLEKRWHLIGEGVSGIEDVRHALDLPLSAAVRRVSVVGVGEPVDLAPDVGEPLAGAALHYDGAAVLLHDFVGDHEAQLWGCPVEGTRDLDFLRGRFVFGRVGVLRVLDGGAVFVGCAVCLLLNMSAKIHGLERHWRAYLRVCLVALVKVLFAGHGGTIVVR